MVYGEPFEVVGDEEEVAGGDGKYDFRDLYEKDWWWRINRDDVRKRMTADPDHLAENRQPSTATPCSEQASRRRIKTRYLELGRQPYDEDIEANLNARAADESSSQSSSSSSESSCVSVVSDEPDYIGMLGSGVLPGIFDSDGDDEDEYAVVVETTTSSESERKHGSPLVSFAE